MGSPRLSLSGARSAAGRRAGRNANSLYSTVVQCSSYGVRSMHTKKKLVPGRQNPSADGRSFLLPFFVSSSSKTTIHPQDPNNKRQTTKRLNAMQRQCDNERQRTGDGKRKTTTSRRPTSSPRAHSTPRSRCRCRTCGTGRPRIGGSCHVSKEHHE